MRATLKRHPADGGDAFASPPGPAAAAQPASPRGTSAWRQTARRLRRDRAAVCGLVLFGAVLLASLFAPVYASHVSHTDPFASNVSGTFRLHGHTVSVLQQGGGALKLGETPIGPTWTGRFFLGADQQGRDVMARILYGGRSSLLIGVGAALLSSTVALMIGLLAGFFGGTVDLLLSRMLDLMWAFPTYLLAISLSAVLLTQGLHLGFVTVSSGSLLLPLFVIGLVYIPYVARPIRAEVLSVRQREFIEAAIGQGATLWRVLFRELLPNVIVVPLVMLPLLVATNILTESALSFLSIGVQPPDASWGSIIGDGQGLLYSRPWVAIAPGIMIVVTVISLQLLSGGLRRALDVSPSEERAA